MQAKKIAAALVAGFTALTLSACGNGIAGGGSGSGDGAKTTFRLAFNQTEQHPQFKAAEELGKKLEEATDGRYSIEVFANETLGSQNEVVQNVSDGTVDMMYIGGPVLESFNQDFIVFNLPYVFDSQKAQAKVFADDAVMGDLKASIEDSKKITVLGALHAGTRNVYNAKQPIKSPADMANLKIRVQQSDSQVRMIELMGAVASPMGQGDVYSALQTGVLDGAENNETVYNALKHDEVAKFYSYTRHLMIPDYLLISSKALNTMPEADRQALIDLVPEIQKMADDGFQDFIKKSIDSSKSIGAQFNDDVDTAAFKERVQPLVDETVNANDVRKTLYAAIQEANAAHPAG